MANVEALTRAGIDYDGALDRFGGNAALYLKLAAKYLDDAHFTALEAALAADDAATAESEAHALKGVAGNLSFTTLYDQAKTINDLLRTGDAASAKALLPEAKATDARIREALAAL